MQRKSKILVTGASGLLGRNLVDSLHNGYEIHSVIRTKPNSQIKDVYYHFIDLSTDWGNYALPDSVDTIIHLAQSVHFRDFPDKAQDIFKVNVDSTARLLDYARDSGVKQFIYASSGGVYGSSDFPFNENAPIIPPGQLNYYLGSKLCSEVLVQSHASLMNVIILRFFFMYGPGQRRSMLIPRLIDSVRLGRPIYLQGQDGIRINPIHVYDAAAALRIAISLRGSYTVNIAGPEVLTLREITEIISQKVGLPAIFNLQDEEPKHIVANIDTMKSMLSTPRILICDGLNSLIDEKEL